VWTSKTDWRRAVSRNEANSLRQRVEELESQLRQQSGGGSGGGAGGSAGGGGAPPVTSAPDAFSRPPAPPYYQSFSQQSQQSQPQQQPQQPQPQDMAGPTQQSYYQQSHGVSGPFPMPQAGGFVPSSFRQNVGAGGMQERDLGSSGPSSLAPPRPNMGPSTEGVPMSQSPQTQTSRGGGTTPSRAPQTQSPLDLAGDIDDMMVSRPRVGRWQSGAHQLTTRCKTSGDGCVYTDRSPPSDTPECPSLHLNNHRSKPALRASYRTSS
jgi:hypothetical protein